MTCELQTGRFENADILEILDGPNHTLIQIDENRSNDPPNYPKY